MAALRVRSVGLGIHAPATVRRHADRTLPVHELIIVEAGVLPIAEASTEHDVREGSGSCSAPACGTTAHAASTTGRGSAGSASPANPPPWIGDRRHPDHLGRAFRNDTGVPITMYIHQERVDHARTLLRTSDVPIDRVAAASGFRGARYFRRIFLRHAGVSPSAYRSVHR